MGIRVDNKIVEAAISAPQVFIAASVGEGQEYHRGVGIQLTKEQIISLRKYEVSMITPKAGPHCVRTSNSRALI
jgi:hypothetical protein